ncbi:hypothetical protein KOW79_007954 [Hemibagrus wyckioides]|uniref:Uncharacterized protein n=1 Tax=Hemibagrus wyckioides TaxID=337641 RepID=A0A9D3SLM6_9TELE|nr:hypothetical protein KOW79_007954 [Hemibagrus wyckioides]
MAMKRPRAGQHTGARRIREQIIKRDVLLAAQTPSASLKHLFVLKSEQASTHPPAVYLRELRPGCNLRETLLQQVSHVTCLSNSCDESRLLGHFGRRSARPRLAVILLLCDVNYTSFCFLSDKKKKISKGPYVASAPDGNLLRADVRRVRREVEVQAGCRGNCVTTVTQRRPGVRFHSNGGGWVWVTGFVNSFAREPQGSSAICPRSRWALTSY